MQKHEYTSPSLYVRVIDRVVVDAEGMRAVVHVNQSTDRESMLKNSRVFFFVETCR